MNINLFQPKINIIVQDSKYLIDLDVSKKSKYIDNIINKNTILGFEVKKDINLEIELKPIFFHEKSMNIIINYLKYNKFIFDSDNFDLFIDVVLCVQYLDINNMILDIRNFFLEILNNIKSKFSLNNYTEMFFENNNV